MLASREDIQESTEGRDEAALRLQRRKRGDVRLRSEKKLQIGKDVGQHSSVGMHGRFECGSPASDLRVRVDQQPADQLVKSLRQAGVGNVLLLLIELTCRK